MPRSIQLSCLSDLHPAGDLLLPMHRSVKQFSIFSAYATYWSALDVTNMVQQTSEKQNI